MEEFDKQRLIERIQKLLNLGNGNANVNESLLAKEKAARLMADYAISMSEIIVIAGERNEAFIRTDIEGTEEKKVHWESILAFRIAKAFDCSTVNTQGLSSGGWGNYVWNIAFLGTPSDLELVIHFFKFLRRTVGISSEKAFPSRKQDRVAYAYSMSEVLGKRLAELYQMRNELSSECRALVPIKKEGLNKFIRKEFPSLISSNYRIGGSREAWEQGREAGGRVSLHRPLKGGSNYQQLS